MGIVCTWQTFKVLTASPSFNLKNSNKFSKFSFEFEFLILKFNVKTIKKCLIKI